MKSERDGERESARKATYRGRGTDVQTNSIHVLPLLFLAVFFKDGEIKLYILEWSPPVSCWITLHPFPSWMLDYPLPFCLYGDLCSYFAVLR